MVKRGARIAAAVAVGYLLGRRRRLQLALTLGAAAAAGRLSAHSGGLLRRGAESLFPSAELGKLSGLGRPLVAAGKTAAMTAVSSRIDTLGDQLQDRAETLRRGGTGIADARSRSTSDTAEEEYDDESYDDEHETARTRPPSGRRRTDEPEEPEDEHDGFDDADDGFDDADEDDEELPPRSPARSRQQAAPVRRRGR